jgi:hypothetical protein
MAACRPDRLRHRRGIILLEGVMSNTELFVEIARGPCCPICRNDGFDDWWHDKSCRSGHSMLVELCADLRCDECDLTFEVTKYTDGETHSTYRRPLAGGAGALSRDNLTAKGE